MITEGLELKFKRMVDLHWKTRRYQLMSELIGAEVFIQPIKEERDAYDHLMKLFECELKASDGIDRSDYISRQVEKALGHGYRALYDSLDYLHLVITDRIVEELSNCRDEGLLLSSKEYTSVRAEIFDINEEILKEKKLKDSASDSTNEDTYCHLIEQYYGCYKKIVLEILPEYWKKKS